MSFQPVSFGLHDVLGNVREWRRYGNFDYDLAARPGDGLRSASAPRNRVLRGGSFNFVASDARSALHAHDTPEFASGGGIPAAA